MSNLRSAVFLDPKIADINIHNNLIGPHELTKVSFFSPNSYGKEGYGKLLLHIVWMTEKAGLSQINTEFLQGLYDLHVLSQNQEEFTLKIFFEKLSVLKMQLDTEINIEHDCNVEYKLDVRGEIAKNFSRIENHPELEDRLLSDLIQQETWKNVYTELEKLFSHAYYATASTVRINAIRTADGDDSQGHLKKFEEFLNTIQDLITRYNQQLAALDIIIPQNPVNNAQEINLLVAKMAYRTAVNDLSDFMKNPPEFKTPQEFKNKFLIQANNNYKSIKKYEDFITLHCEKINTIENFSETSQLMEKFLTRLENEKCGNNNINELTKENNKE